MNKDKGELTPLLAAIDGSTLSAPGTSMSNIPLSVKDALGDLAPDYVCRGNGDGAGVQFIQFIYHDNAKALAAAQKLFVEGKVQRIENFGKSNARAAPLRVNYGPQYQSANGVAHIPSFAEKKLSLIRVFPANYQSVFGDFKFLTTRAQLEKQWSQEGSLSASAVSVSHAPRSKTRNPLQKVQPSQDAQDLVAEDLEYQGQLLDAFDAVDSSSGSEESDEKESSVQSVNPVQQTAAPVKEMEEVGNKSVAVAIPLGVATQDGDRPNAGEGLLDAFDVEEDQDEETYETSEKCSLM
jgi:hypothetical protein